MKTLHRVAPGRYEGDGIIIQKRNLYRQPWQAYRRSERITSNESIEVHEHAGSYGSLAEALFHCKAEVVK